MSSPVLQQASSAPGSISGTVQDERGLPLANVVVSILGAVTTVSVTDANGRFEFGMLAPGPYLLRAHHAGFMAPRPQMVHVRASARAVSALALRREGAPAVLAAGVGVPGLGEPLAATPPIPSPPATAPASSGSSDPTADRASDDHGDTAWRVRHARRGVLKDLTLPEGLIADDEPSVAPTGTSGFDRTIGTSVRLAANLFDADLTGQVNLLTSGTFDSPQQLFSSDGLSRNVANFRIGAPAGPGADWSVVGAITEADVSSWVVAGAYSLRAPATHRYDVGLTYSTQRYGGGNPLALRDLSDGSRNVATVYAYDSFSIGPAATLSFGAEYGRYDYLANRTVMSPRAELTVSPSSQFRVTGSVAQRALAPGAEEFRPPAYGVWLPPQRTFSPLEHGGRFLAQRSTSVSAGVERDFGQATLALRAFREHGEDQLVTMFGTEVPGYPEAKLGHYLVGNLGDADAAGYTAEFRALIASRVHGAVAYSVARGRIVQAGHRYLMVLAPESQSITPSTVHDVTARIDTEVPETATRVTVVYRLSNGFAQPLSRRAAAALDGRFDVQVRQSLPFINFNGARWEMLLAVRNFFRDAATAQSLFDELMVVRPPTRVVGGVTLHF